MSDVLGVLLMTFGSASTAAGVREYMRSVRGGRDAPEDVIAEFEHRYATVGRSPLVDITEQQARLLQEELNRRDIARSIRVRVGMLHSPPRIADALGRLRDDGARSVIALVLAPQYSPIILAGYERAISAARELYPELDIRTAGAWHALPEWIASLAGRLRAAMGELGDPEPVIFTAHSLPRSVVDRDPRYIEQLQETARAVAADAGLEEGTWQFAYQSAGHTPEEWLTPDVKDLLPGLRDRGARSVLVAPVQFVADHLEILYDIDVAARDEAQALGVTLRRIELPNASPAFIAALAAVVARELSPTAT